MSFGDSTLMDTPDIDQLGVAVGIVIDARYREGVALNLARLLAQARLVMDVELPMEAEPASVFLP